MPDCYTSFRFQALKYCLIFEKEKKKKDICQQNITKQELPLDIYIEKKYWKFDLIWRF